MTNDELVAWLTDRVTTDKVEFVRVAGDERNQYQALHTDSDLNEGYIVYLALQRIKDCESKLKIIELHTGTHECVGFNRPDSMLSGATRTVYVAPGYVNELDPTLLLMAQAYEDCPAEWKQ